MNSRVPSEPRNPESDAAGMGRGSHAKVQAGGSAAGDHRNGTGFAEHALPHLKSVRRFAMSLERDEANADDLAQETYLRAFRGWHTFHLGTDCRKWLFTICRNTFRRRHSRKSVEVEYPEGDADALPAVLDHAAAVQGGLGDLFDRIDVLPAIQRAIGELPEIHQSVLVLVDVEGLSYEEAGEVLDVPVGTVRSRLFRARRVIQAELIRHAQDMGLAKPNEKSCDHLVHSGEGS